MLWTSNAALRNDLITTNHFKMMSDFVYWRMEIYIEIINDSYR